MSYRKLLITFSGHLYDDQTRMIVENGPKMGADRVLVYDDLWLTQQPFYRMNSWLWAHPHKRGFGWYAWKPFIIQHALEHHAHEGDVVMYVDGDTFPTWDFSVLYEQAAKDGAMFFRAGEHQNRLWCKRDCLLVMGMDPLLPPYPETGAVLDRQAGVARFMLFRNGWWREKQFLQEWLTYCVNPRATTFDRSVLRDEHDGFVEHRTEQAIMTLLTYKYGYRLWPEICYEPIEELGLPVCFCQENTRPPESRQQTSEVKGSAFRNV